MFVFDESHLQVCSSTDKEPQTPVRLGEDHRRSQAEGPRDCLSQDWWCRGVGCLREPERESPKNKKQKQKAVSRVETSEQETERETRRRRGNRSDGDGGGGKPVLFIPESFEHISNLNHMTAMIEVLKCRSKRQSKH